MTLPPIDTLHRWQAVSDHSAVLEALQDLSAEGHQPPSHAVLLKGISLALNGAREAARPYLQAALGAFEQDADADHDGAYLSDLGLALLLLGQAQRAYATLKQAIGKGSVDAVTHGRLGAAALALGQLEAAREAYQEAVDREPGRAEWHNNLGGILVRQQRLDAALEQYDIALRHKPDMEKALESRQRVLMALERTDEVIEQLERQLAEDPENTGLRLRLARALAHDNRLAEAINRVQEVLLPAEEVEGPRTDACAGEEGGDENGNEDAPVGSRDAQLRLRALLADLFAQRDLHGRVIAVVDDLLRLDPEDPAPHLQRKAHALTEMGRHAEAEALLDEAEEAHPQSNALKLARAGLYCEAGRYAEAEAIQRELLETYPGHAGLKSQLGQTLLWTGKLDEAAELFAEAAEINPMALAQMVNAKHLPEDPAALERMECIADNPLLPDPARITMSFALAEIYDKRREIDRAFHYLDQGNRLTDRTLAYDPARFRRQVDALKAVYTHAFFAAQPAIRKSDRTPVFVVGMPRSGTTLTEQILCSHPDIFGAGELDLMARLSRLMPRVIQNGKPYPDCLDAFTPHLREEAARFYLRGLGQHDTRHSFVVDKMPHNFMHLGLIALIFPGARIIHIQRDPRDTALSNFQQNFKAKNGGMGYAFDLEKIAEQINDYHRMMAHWRAVLPLPMFELTYEELVADQEGMTRQLLEFVGVDWHDSVRDFHKTERAVRTASVSQVRQPIYQSSRQKWRRYEAHLRPLLDRLEPEVTAPWDNAKERA
ncbi:tetratricopeptide repeat-containing sulfotransferase family protein [Ectothiorhodospira mobilis]|uniref:tetratricopeptide repeat-containing sulfotransferase family protein n=1 Tax=Ectothiorhodospira mobilis TaxID=195064 RepID=UPI001EE789FB|nr:tetratricopeptide repeat-containing sulfotransferase family protein [Ectothiorhodospira mobilis]MCG5534659.1 sulfotransferase [Ectothiorhodospira mobilis]